MGTVPVPYSPVAGDDATQAHVLTWADSDAYLLGSATSGGSRRPNCVMRQTVAQSVPNNTGTAVTFDVEDVDYDNGHSTVTNTSRYTAQTAGWYDIEYHASFAANGASINKCWLVLNGVTAQPGTGRVITPNAAQASGLGGARKIFLNVGDYVELNVLQTTGAALNTNVTAPEGGCYMGVEWRSN